MLAPFACCPAHHAEDHVVALGASRTNFWKALETRLVGHDSAGEGMHVRIQAELNAGAQAAALAMAGEECYRKLCNRSAAREKLKQAAGNSF